MELNVPAFKFFSLRNKILCLCVVFSICLVCFPTSLFSQFISIKISIKTDTMPENISWSLYNDATGFLLLSDDETMEDELTIYDFNVTGNCLDCYRFEINVEGENGLGEDGHYSLQVDGDWVVYQGRLVGESNILYVGTCSYGDVCSNPMFIQELQYANYIVTPRENTWFSFTPTKNGFYTISTCQNKDDDGNFLDTKLWIYDDCPTEVSDGPVGANHYNDESLVCQESAFLSLVPMIANQKYIIRLGNLNDEWEEKLKMTISRNQDVVGCTDPLSCTYNPFATLDDESCNVDTTCGPDLFVNDTLLVQSIFLDTINVLDSCLILEDCINGFGKRDIVRFSTAIYNIGTADFVVGDPSVNSGGFSDDNCHDHWHQLGYAEYLVYSGAGQPEPVSLKNGFCMLDIACTDEVYVPKYSCSFMGITAGCFDVYDSSLPCQWIDVTDMADGDYTLVVRINWNRSADLRGMEELSYDNNWAQVCINLDRSSGELILIVLEDCATYVDCKGEAYGDAVYDCKGECDGFAHAGDMNENLEVDTLDIESYFGHFENGLTYKDACTDLDGNEILNLYDAALLQECIKSNPNPETDPYHSHCLFPAGIENLTDTVWLRMNNMDELNKTFDIEYYSPSANVIGMHIEINGAEIIDLSVVNESLFDYETSNSNDLFLLSKNQFLPFNFSFAKLATVSFDNVIADSICIVSFTDAVNEAYHLLPSFVVDGCKKLVVSSNIVASSDEINIFPNPTRDNFSMEIRGSKTLMSYELYNTNGMKVQSYENLNTERIICNTENMADGVYYIRMILSDETQSYHRIVIAE